MKSAVNFFTLISSILSLCIAAIAVLLYVLYLIYRLLQETDEIAPFKHFISHPLIINLQWFTPWCTHNVANKKGNGCNCTRCTRGSGIPDPDNGISSFQEILENYVLDLLCDFMSKKPSRIDGISSRLLKCFLI